MYDLPPIQFSPAAWYGPDMATRAGEWLLRLSAAEIAELEQAANAWLDTARPLADITPQAFVLPTLGPRLQALRDEMLHGRGFVLLRGLPVQRYDADRVQTMFCGLGSHLGHARPQNAAGDLLGHVRDFGLASSDPSVRIYQTRERQTFHTDSADVVGLLCLRPARTGGDSLLVSAVTIFNEMHRRWPESLRLLLQPVATDRRGEIPTGARPYFLIPVFSWHAGFLTVIYQRQYIDSAQRFPDAPRLEGEHVLALDRFDQLANDPQLHLTMRLHEGDMQFVYNHALLHDRTGFEDWPEPDRKRHLLRLWLAIPGDRPLPPCFADRYGSLAVGDRGGVRLSRA